MRQRTTLIVTGAVAASLVVLVIISGFLRGQRHHDETPGEHEQEHAPAAEENHKSEPPALSGKVEDGVRVVVMIARQFQFDPNRIVVAEAETVRLELTNADVTHGIGIPDLEINRTLEPGKTESITFQAPAPGSYPFFCTVYCGEGHADMHGEIVVVAAE